MNSSTDLLHLEEVCARYSDAGPDGPYVLNRVSLCIPPDAGLVALTGPNGCGKTSMLRVIMGQLDVDKGSVWFRGHDVTGEPTHERRGMSAIFQRASDGLCAALTIEENLCLALSGTPLGWWRPLVTRERRATIHKRARAVSGGVTSPFLGELLASVLDKYPGMFSGGEVQQLCLFAVMIQDPAAHLLLADEPTLNLDRTNREACLEMLAAISRTMPVLVATHDSDLIARARSVLTMERGCMGRIG